MDQPTKLIPHLINKLDSILNNYPTNPTPILPNQSTIDSEINRTIIFIVSDKSYRISKINRASLQFGVPKKKNKISVYRDRIFRATFSSIENADIFLKNGPWLFENDLIVMEKCRPRTLADSYKLDHCEF